MARSTKRLPAGVQPRRCGTERGRTGACLGRRTRRLRAVVVARLAVADAFGPAPCVAAFFERPWRSRLSHQALPQKERAMWRPSTITGSVFWPDLRRASTSRCPWALLLATGSAPASGTKGVDRRRMRDRQSGEARIRVQGVRACDALVRRFARGPSDHRTIVTRGRRARARRPGARRGPCGRAGP